MRAVVVVVAAVLTVSACGVETPEGTDSGETGRIHLMVDADEAGGFEVLELTASACGDSETFVADRMSVADLVRQTLMPAHVQDDDHLFVEINRSLEVGCYDLEVRLSGQGGDSGGESQVATRSGLEIEKGGTTELLVFADRAGAASPIRAVSFESGFRVGCGERIEVCATVDDGEPFELQWDVPGRTPATESVPEAARSAEASAECGRWAAAGESGESVIELSVRPAQKSSTDRKADRVGAVSFTIYTDCPTRTERGAVEPPAGDAETTILHRADD